MTHYELRPRNGKPLYTFDRLDRAKEFRMQHFSRTKIIRERKAREEKRAKEKAQ